MAALIAVIKSLIRMMKSLQLLGVRTAQHVAALIPCTISWITATMSACAPFQGDSVIECLAISRTPQRLNPLLRQWPTRVLAPAAIPTDAALAVVVHAMAARMQSS